MEPNELKSVLECLLFVADKPLSLNNLQALLETVERRTLLATLDELKAEYDMQGRAFQLVEIAEGYQLSTRVQFAPWIRKLYKTKPTNHLSRASLEPLAIIAYRQPVTKAEVEDIRGVASDGVVSALLERKMIRIVGRKEVVGRPLLYGTTKEFLHYFGLKDLSDMPTLKDLQDILKSDDAGKAWELNEQGELVARLSDPSETADQPGTPGEPEVSDPTGASASPEASEGTGSSEANLPEAPEASELSVVSDGSDMSEAEGTPEETSDHSAVVENEPSKE